MMFPVMSATLSTQFPGVWVAALTCFIGFVFWAWSIAPTSRTLFLLLWAPSALGAVVVYRLDGYGLSVWESLHGMAMLDPEIVRLFRAAPGDPGVALYGIAVGGAAAIFATLTLHMLGVATGALLALFQRTPPGPSPWEPCRRGGDELRRLPSSEGREDRDQ